DQTHPTTGMGLETMSVRAKRFGGNAVVNSAPGLGCSLKVLIPATAQPSRVYNRHGEKVWINAVGAAIAAYLVWKLQVNPVSLTSVAFYVAFAIYNGVQFLRSRRA